MNPLCRQLGLALPIIQAPMAGVQDSALALAVSAAGGLGSVPCAMLDPDTMVKEMGVLKNAAGGPFNLNFFAHTPPPDDLQASLRWDALLAGYRVELGLNSQPAASGPARLPFNEAAAIGIESLRPAVVSFHFGLPEAALLERVKRSGAMVLSSATSVAEARWLERHGVDAVIAQGLEAGGHRGHFLNDDLSLQSGTFALLPQIVKAVEVPVIAAGGIADAAGVAAALLLGASAVQVGTAYLLCEQARTSALHRAALRSPLTSHTVLTNVFSGRPARGMINRVVRELGPMSTQVPPFPLAAAGLAPLRQAAEALGRDDFTPLWAGQNASTCRETDAGALTRELAAGLPV